MNLCCMYVCVLFLLPSFSRQMCMRCATWGCLFFCCHSNFTLNTSIANGDRWLCAWKLNGSGFLFDNSTNNNNKKKLNISSSYLPFDLAAATAVLVVVVVGFPLWSFFDFVRFPSLQLGPTLFPLRICFARVGCYFNYTNALGKLKSHIFDSNNTKTRPKQQRQRRSVCLSCLHLSQLNAHFVVFFTFSLICKYNLQRRHFFFPVPLASLLRI